MRRLLFAVGIALWASPASANWELAVGQNTPTTNGDDQVMTFTNPIGNGNIVFIVASIGTTGQTVQIDNSTFTISACVGPLDVSTNRRVYIFCGTGDGTDGTFTVTTSAGGSALAFGIEFTGGTTNLDGSAQFNEDTSSPYELSTDVTASGSNSLLIGTIRSTTGADFDPGANVTQFGADGLPGAAGYRILTASGSYDMTWTDATGEITIIAAAAFQASAAVASARRGLLLGVGN